MMAAELDDGVFWLPPQFLTDDDFPIGGENKFHHQTKKSDDFSFLFGNSFSPFSDLSSPVESVMGSTETESDEDDYLNELTRKIAQSTVRDSIYPIEIKQGWRVSGSPQSTLCSVMGNRGPNCFSGVSSPPEGNRKNLTPLDLLSAAAEEVARMKTIEETLGFYSTTNYRGGVDGLFAPPKNPTRGPGFYPSHPQVPVQHLQTTHFQKLKEQEKIMNQLKEQEKIMNQLKEQEKMMNQLKEQEKMMNQLKEREKMMNQHQQASTMFYGQLKGGYPQMGHNNVRSNSLSMDAWCSIQQPQKQQQPSSGMRALFLGDPMAKKERTGTGVFLPKRAGAPTETRKKSGCSTVLLPDRVVQALNLNLEAAVDSQPENKANGNFFPDYAAAVKYRNNAPMAQQRRNQKTPPVTNHDLRLPQEWTY